MDNDQLLIKAKEYINSMANGINPLTGEKIDDDDLLCNVRIVRCLFYVESVLDSVINNKKSNNQNSKKVKFSITKEQLEKFEYSDSDISLSEIRRRVNNLIDEDTMKGISFKEIVNIAITSNLIEVRTEDEQGGKVPTEFGSKMGVSLKQRMSMYGRTFEAVYYDINAQQYLISKLEENYCD